MSDPVIRVEGLSKRYLLRHQQPERYTALRDVIARRFRSLGRGVRARGGAMGGGASLPAPAREDFWALRDVSFEIRRGERVGIIGRNGAGKSTLLKILSRITEPTTGRIELEGRVASLLEVGTGFHPELTGRENIFLNGAILGMGRAEIRRKFDEIVAFAEVEKFLDTPVKRYSSGMFVRLAFAVAAHLEPEILAVDEVLAVGDADFQKKCIGKMEGVAAEGRTVLFVSHVMPTILRLCDRSILLDGGSVVSDGCSADVVERYLGGTGTSCERVWADPAQAPGDAVARLRAVRVLDDAGAPAGAIDIRRGCLIEIEYDCLPGAGSLRPTAVFQLLNQAGTVLFASGDFTNLGWRRRPREAGRVHSRCRIPGDLLAEGRFTLLAAVVHYNPNLLHAIERDAVTFTVVDHSTGDGARGECALPWPGEVRPLLDWDVSFAAKGASA